MKAMGSQRGYDPLPPSQHEWQGAEGEPPIHRMWSWFCAHTVTRERMSPFAVRADGTPATLKDVAKDLGMDLGQASNLFKWGQAKGLWCKKNGRELYFSGEVTVQDVERANKERNVECTLNLSPSELLIIKKWPQEMRARFLSVWEAAQVHHRADLAVTIAEKRRLHAEIDLSIRDIFPLPKKRKVSVKPIQRVEMPALVTDLLQSVHSAGVHSPRPECTQGEETGENVSVQPAVSLLVPEKYQSDIPASASSVLDQEADRLVSALMIDAAAAVDLLLNTRKVEPSITWREVLVLAEKKLGDTKPKHSKAGLLLSTVPGMARGAMLAFARERANFLETQESTAGRFQPREALTDQESAELNQLLGEG